MIEFDSVVPETDLEFLIRQLEKATGPDRQLDRMIEETLPGVRQHDDKRMVADGYVIEENDIQAYLPPHYTDSINDALKLLEYNQEFEVGSAHLLEIYWARIISIKGEYKGKGKTPAIALSIAALKARIILKEIE